MLNLTDEARLAWREGLIAVRPALIATGTWGLVSGVAMVKSGLTESAALMMTLLVYAGSAQLTSLPLIATGAPLWLIFVAGCVVNLRFVIFSAALQPYFQNQSWQRRLAYGYLTTDMAFALFIPRFGDDKVRGTLQQRWYFLGMIIPGWIVWQTSSILGIFLGTLVPSAWSLEYAAVLALMAITVPLATTRPMLFVMLVTGVVAWLTQALPLRLGLLVAVISGIISGMLIERRSRKKES
ncbi:AzlC family ABC transporter permease [Orrella sp. 11846]|uniref:AzlC family ABC transporter permease n=1 Tax=Orrella sp. 11846 TaxID=3409913 RepID=UPI003B5A0159